MFGAKLIYTPGNGPGYRPNYRGFSGAPATPRQIQLQQDGFTLAFADTLSPGSAALMGMAGTHGNRTGALVISSKVAVFGSQRKNGVGFGINYAVLPQLQLIAEVTPVSNGEPLVWAAGLRYGLAGSGLTMDLQATNAVGRYGLGTMVGQSETKITLGATMRLNFMRR